MEADLKRRALPRSVLVVIGGMGSAAIIAVTPFAVAAFTRSPPVTLAVIGWLGAIMLLVLTPWLLIPISIGRVEIREGAGDIVGMTVYGRRVVHLDALVELSAITLAGGNMPLVLLVLKDEGGRLGIQLSPRELSGSSELLLLLQRVRTHRKSLRVTRRAALRLGDDLPLPDRLLVVAATGLRLACLIAAGLLAALPYQLLTGGIGSWT